MIEKMTRSWRTMEEPPPVMGRFQMMRENGQVRECELSHLDYSYRFTDTNHPMANVYVHPLDIVRWRPL